MKKNSKDAIRNKADRVLQAYIRAKCKDELCELCGEKPVTVGHHFIYKSQSLALRFVLENIIGLCRDCHLYAHRWQNLFAAKITAKRGEEWLRNLEEVRREAVKFTKEWVETQLKILTEMTEELLEKMKEMR